MTDAHTALLETIPTGLFINGTWRESADGSTFGVTNPADGTTLVNVASATVADGTQALDASCAAQSEWAATSARDRSVILRRAFDLVTERAEDFALLMTLEMGKPLAESRGEVTYGAEFLRWFSEEGPRVQGRHGSNPEGTGTIMVTQHPVGPSLLVTPWNFPLAMATRKIAPALAAGCTVVIKPASATPLTTMLFAAVLEEAGVPPGVVNVIPTLHSGTICEPLIRDPRLRKLSFTGSTPVGVTLLEQAARNVLRTSMELGGNAPFIVFDDADLEAAVDGAIAAKFRNIGQACTAANRFFVHRDIADAFVTAVTQRVREMKVGPGTEDGVDIGPLIDSDALAKVERLVDNARQLGATVTTGGHPSARGGTFYEPTVLKDVPPHADIVHEEIFGPVLAISTFATEDEAVTRANDTEFGLVSYVFTESLARGQRMTQHLDAGMVGLNVGVLSNAAAPFGGWKMSGLGREGGAEGIHEYLETKYTLTPR
ncbi:NAD-dependent succinate-semialdehyde dehydrogenase [Demequina sediminicola]|uniref:NAD-dependent succinate-semialdehyde dehydrogenase n=1 Tax=Demequina sediminicola TaxID=1095026 RepID=UPI000781251A|nr:NAD-dependent succinate-semialdehyde dehydrogenase [Demequina sediminicola]